MPISYVHEYEATMTTTGAHEYLEQEAAAKAGGRRREDLQQKFGQCLSWETGEIQTLMIRNLPRKYTEQALLRELEGFLPPGSYNFFYLPWNTRRSSNDGYAFINFLHASTAHALFKGLDGKPWQLVEHSKPIKIMPAHLQGLAQNLVHYMNREVIGGGHAHTPIVLCNGKRMDFQEAVKLYCPPELILQNDTGNLAAQMDPATEPSGAGRPMEASAPNSYLAETASAPSSSCGLARECCGAGGRWAGPGRPTETSAPRSYLTEKTSAPSSYLTEKTSAPSSYLTEKTSAPSSYLTEKTSAPSSSCRLARECRGTAGQWGGAGDSSRALLTQMSTRSSLCELKQQHGLPDGSGQGWQACDRSALSELSLMETEGGFYPQASQHSQAASNFEGARNPELFRLLASDVYCTSWKKLNKQLQDVLAMMCVEVLDLHNVG